MKKAQFFLLFSLVFSFFILIFYYKIEYKENIKDIKIIKHYFENEVSYLTTLNCSYDYRTLLDFINKTKFNIKLIYYFDTCQKKIIQLRPYKENLTIKETPYTFIVCLENHCKNIPKLGKRFCLVYELNSKIFFSCF
jgi:hypothetical protein